jgi:hypothetical protein
MSFSECLYLQGVIRKEPNEAHMSGLHRDKTPTYEKEASRRVRKATPGGEGPPVRGQGARPDPWGTRPGQELIMAQLVDYASTAFEDQSKPVD